MANGFVFNCTLYAPGPASESTTDQFPAGVTVNEPLPSPAVAKRRRDPKNVG
jgi:hypothetical protein